MSASISSGRRGKQRLLGFSSNSFLGEKKRRELHFSCVPCPSRITVLGEQRGGNKSHTLNPVVFLVEGRGSRILEPAIGSPVSGSNFCFGAKQDG